MGGVGGERFFEFDWEEEGMGAYSRLGAYLNFHHFQQVKYVHFATKQ